MAYRRAMSKDIGVRSGVFLFHELSTFSRRRLVIKWVYAVKHGRKAFFMLTGEKVRIRLAREDDADMLADWWADGDIMEHAGFPKGLATDRERLKKRLRRQWDDKKAHRVYILEDASGTAVGEMSSSFKDDATGVIGIKICEAAAQGKGLGPDALKTLMAHVLFDLGAARIELDTMVENTRAQHVYESLGFDRTAIKKDAWTDQLGRKRTSVEYRITKDAFKKLHPDRVPEKGTYSGH